MITSILILRLFVYKQPAILKGLLVCILSKYFDTKLVALPLKITVIYIII